VIALTCAIGGCIIAVMRGPRHDGDDSLTGQGRQQPDD
jgi:hypothetical protein